MGGAGGGGPGGGGAAGGAGNNAGAGKNAGANRAGVNFTDRNLAQQITTKNYPLNEVQIFDMALNPIDAKELAKLLPKEIPALIVRGRQPLDALHFRLHKEGTLLFMLPAQAGVPEFGVQNGAPAIKPVSR